MMKVSFLSLLFILRLSECALASPSNTDVAIRSDDTPDDLDAWLAAAQRVSPEALKPCPTSCSSANSKNRKCGRNKEEHPANGWTVTSKAEWFLFPDPTKLASCNETMLLDMIVKITTEDSAAQTVMRACSADYDSNVKAAFVADEEKASRKSLYTKILWDTN
jgi:hypothetical protein